MKRSIQRARRRTTSATREADNQTFFAAKAKGGFFRPPAAHSHCPPGSPCEEEMIHRVAETEKHEEKVLRAEEKEDHLAE